MFILIKADANGVSSIETIDKKKMGLQDYYNAIDCHCINIHPLNMQAACIGRQMVVFDDEFLLNTDKPVANKLASALYGYHKHGQCLCGNVVIGKDGGEDINGFTKAEADELVGLYKMLLEDANKCEFVVQEPIMTFFEVKR